MGYNSQMATVDKNEQLKIVVSYIISIVLVTVLSTIIRWLGPDWLFPLDLYLVTTMVHALRKSPMGSLFFGLALGFAQDVYSGSIIGVNALSKMVLAYAASSLKVVFLVRGLFQRLFSICLAVVADHYIRYLVKSIFGLTSDVNTFLLITATALNGAAGLLMLLYKLSADKREVEVQAYEKSE